MSHGWRMRQRVVTMTHMGIQRTRLNRVDNDPSARRPKPRSAVVRFMEKVEIQPRGCWLWLGHRKESGYGHFSYGKTTIAHRAAYILLVGPIAEGLQIDHLCRNPSCVNPDHLEPVTPSENQLRASKGWESCDRLHPHTPTRIGQRGDGRAFCRECQRLRERQRRADFAARMAARKTER